MNSPYRVAVTGGIGSGKSTVCGLFSTLGVPIIDADMIAREVVEPGSAGLQALVSTFGEDILTQTGELDRKALSDKVFNDAKQLEQLNAIVHPLVYSVIENRIAAISEPYCIVAIPLLYETNGQAIVDRVLLIDSPVELQIKRTMQRDSISRKRILKIIDSQMPRDEKRRLADDILDNSGSIIQLQQKIVDLHNQYLALANAR